VMDFSIDILASKLITTNQQRSRNRSPNCITRNRSRSGPGIRALSPEMCLVTHVERDIEEGGADSNSREGVEISEHREEDNSGYVISRDIVDFSSVHSKTTDFEFLVGRVDACL
jgi:hypothetical protein